MDLLPPALKHDRLEPGLHLDVARISKIIQTRRLPAGDVPLNTDLESVDRGGTVAG